MKSLMFAGALALCGGGLASAAPPPAHLCKPGEKVVFNCFGGTKTASLCATRDPRSKRTQLRYAFGKPGAIELELSQAKVPFSWGVYSAHGGDYLRMRNGAYAYVLYEGEGPAWYEAGLLVETGGKTASQMVCRNLATGDEHWGPVYDAKLPDDRDRPDIPEPRRRR